MAGTDEHNEGEDRDQYGDEDTGLMPVEHESDVCAEEFERAEVDAVFDIGDIIRDEAVPVRVGIVPNRFPSKCVDDLAVVEKGGHEQRVEGNGAEAGEDQYFACCPPVVVFAHAPDPDGHKEGECEVSFYLCRPYLMIGSP